MSSSSFAAHVAQFAPSRKNVPKARKRDRPLKSNAFAMSRIDDYWHDTLRAIFNSPERTAAIVTCDEIVRGPRRLRDANAAGLYGAVLVNKNDEFVVRTDRCACIAAAQKECAVNSRRLAAVRDGRFYNFYGYDAIVVGSILRTAFNGLPDHIKFGIPVDSFNTMALVVVRAGHEIVMYEPIATSVPLKDVRAKYAQTQVLTAAQPLYMYLLTDAASVQTYADMGANYVYVALAENDAAYDVYSVWPDDQRMDVQHAVSAHALQAYLDAQSVLGMFWLCADKMPSQCVRDSLWALGQHVRIDWPARMRTLTDPQACARYVLERVLRSAQKYTLDALDAYDIRWSEHARRPPVDAYTIDALDMTLMDWVIAPHEPAIFKRALRAWLTGACGLPSLEVVHACHRLCGKLGSAHAPTMPRFVPKLSKIGLVVTGLTACAGINGYYVRGSRLSHTLLQDVRGALDFVCTLRACESRVHEEVQQIAQHVCAHVVDETRCENLARIVGSLCAGQSAAQARQYACVPDTYVQRLVDTDNNTLALLTDCEHDVVRQRACDVHTSLEARHAVLSHISSHLIVHAVPADAHKIRTNQHKKHPQHIVVTHRQKAKSGACLWLEMPPGNSAKKIMVCHTSAVLADAQPVTALTRLLADLDAANDAVHHAFDAYHSAVAAYLLADGHAGTIVGCWHYALVAQIFYLHVSHTAHAGFTQPTVSQDVSDSLCLDELMPLLPRSSTRWETQKNGSSCVSDLELRGTMLLTGPNTAGKSTFMRSVTAAVLLANTGLLVPASLAVVPFYDSISYRGIARDNPLRGRGALAEESVQTAHVLRRASGQFAFIALDEFASSTEPRAACALLEAMVSYLQNTNTHTIFATHYLQFVNKMHAAHNSTLQFAQVSPDHSITDGICTDSRALDTVQMCGFPDQIVAHAHTLLGTGSPAQSPQQKIKPDAPKKAKQKTQTNAPQRSLLSYYTQSADNARALFSSKYGLPQRFERVMVEAAEYLFKHSPVAQALYVVPPRQSDVTTFDYAAAIRCDMPAVYMMYFDDDDSLYVGETCDLDKRMSSHHVLTRDRQARCWRATFTVAHGTNTRDIEKQLQRWLHAHEFYVLSLKDAA